MTRSVIGRGFQARIWNIIGTRTRRRRHGRAQTCRGGWTLRTPSSEAERAPTKAATLRRALAQGCVVAPFVYDAIQAKLAEAAGLAAVYMTGFGTAASRGFPDMGLLTMTEMVAGVRAIA
ncbi:MAG: isocitrate lyase/phosphoenolpyruvate mutase family protein, partial [Deltaproteobacteria bacterium]|nr:isocitrate lyase/phosphoenolpyruvate mutase family protein [Deltaproteobacteria bacterium]